MWRSHLPRWSGALWAAGAVLFYLLGVVLGQATTGSSLPTQTAGALLMGGSAVWIAWKVSWQVRVAPNPGAGEPVDFAFSAYFG
ncbi:hypothetical protein [Arthrobacter sp. UYCo732]|uniref:hypothetical protein n=1 Tax=Arthrobacter sp. UYCo732 TaxID=3156336 RepID=UPI0033997B1D